MMNKSGVSLVQRVTSALTKASSDKFIRPSCSTTLIEKFEERVKEAEEDKDTQWVDNYLTLRRLTDANQNQLFKMGQLGPPKSERMVMEAISRRVGMEMPKPRHQDSDHVEELEYYFKKFYVPFEEFNKPPPPSMEEDNDAESSETDE